MPATFDALIADPTAKKIFLAEIGYYDLLTRTTGTLYVATEDYCTKPSETPAATQYREGLDVAPWMNRNLFGGEGRIGGVADIGRGEIVLNNLDGHFDGLLRYAFDGRAFTVYVIGEDSPGRPWGRSRFVPVLTGKCASHVVGMDTIAIQISDPRIALDVPLSADFYKGLGACLRYDGVNDKAVSASTFSPSASLTAEFRLRVLNDNSALTTQVVAYHASAWTSAGIDWCVQVDTAGTLQAVLHRRAGAAAVTISHTGVDVRDGVWRHVALTVDSDLAVATLYVAGVSAGTATPAALVSAACEFGIGTTFGATGNWANVEVDEVRYWSAARTPAEIADNRDRTVDPASAGLVHYWRMDEATGGAAFDSVTVSPINLTITGATWVSTYEGGSDLVGKVKPRTIGPADGVEGVLVDPQLNIWQLHGGRVRKFREVQWSGVPKVNGVDYTEDLEHGCIAPLVGVSGVVTADLDGEAAGGYLDVAVDIMRRLFTGYAPLTGDCLSFDGTDDKVTATATCPAGSMSIEAMVYVPAVNSTARMIAGYRPFGTGSEAGMRRLHLRSTAANQVAMIVANDAGTLYTAESAMLPPNQWVRVTGVLDTSAAQVRLYLNGVLAQQTATAGTFTTVRSTFAIGTEPESNTSWFVGRIDDVRLWNTARAAAAIKDNAWQELLGTETGLMQNWKLNDRSGTAAANAVSGGAAGTVAGSPVWFSSEDGSVPIAAAPFDWTTARALNTAPVAHHWSEPITKLEAISEVGDGPGYFHVYENTGALRVGRVDVPKASRLGASAVYLDGSWNGSVYTSLKATGSAAIDPHDSSGIVLCFECWVYPMTWGALQTIACQGVPTALLGTGFLFEGWELGLYNGALVANVAGVAGAYSATVVGPELPINAWSHVGVNISDSPFTGGTMQLLLNGVAVSATSLNPALTFASNKDLWVGSFYGLKNFSHNPFVGIVDEARLWATPRTVASVSRDLLQEISPSTQELQLGYANTMRAYWRMNDAAGAQAADLVGSAHLLFQGSPQWCRPIDAVITDADFVGVPAPMLAELPHALIRVGWDPCFRTMTNDELDGAVSAAKRAFFSAPFRWATYESAASREAHPLTRDLDAVLAHFQTEVAAKAETSRLSAIYSTERRPLKVPVSRQFGRLNPGSLVRLVYPRQGMDRGADFLALGVRDVPSTTEQLATELTLWG